MGISVINPALRHIRRKRQPLNRLMDERRISQRVDKLLPIKISDLEYDVHTETKNISASGAYFPVTKPIEIMTKLNVVLLLPLNKNKTKVIKKINCSGIVVRNDEFFDPENAKFPHRVAIYFSDLKDSDKKTLQSYVNTVIKD